MADSEPASTTSNYPDNKSHSADATNPSRSSVCKLLASTDPFSKEVTDHLVEVFFEHNFQDYNFFSPVIFLQQYTRGTVSPDLLNAICAVAARHSDHPAVIQTPPYSSGQVYVDRVRARMMHLMSRADLEVMQILMLLANADYCSGCFARGYRMEYMAAVMAQELGLHRLYGPDTTLNSEAERISLESKLRTFALCIVNDVTNSLISGLPGTFDHVMESFHSLFNTQDWWVERIAISGKPMEPVDEYSIKILQDVLKPRRIRGGGILNHTIRLFSVAISITQFVKKMPSYEKGGVLHSDKPESTTLDPALTVATATTTTTGCLGSKGILEEYQQLDAKLEQWRAGVPREWEPANAKHMVARTDINCLQAAAAFYSLVILLNRPFLMNACMSAINRRGTDGKPESAQGDGRGITDSEAAVQDKVGERRLLDDQQREMCLNKCIHAADEIVTIAEKFTSDDIKYRGFTYAFSVFTSGTV
ncbi:hypothetical protein BGX24_000275 [Mortierella sp. AD032]|nr:hypothetical protein BGX24_000275 [Mortierella sp. AD032]